MNLPRKRPQAQRPYNPVNEVRQPAPAPIEHVTQAPPSPLNPDYAQPSATQAIERDNAELRMCLITERFQNFVSVWHGNAYLLTTAENMQQLDQYARWLMEHHEHMLDPRFYSAVAAIANRDYRLASQCFALHNIVLPKAITQN